MNVASTASTAPPPVGTAPPPLAPAPGERTYTFDEAQQAIEDLWVQSGADRIRIGAGSAQSPIPGTTKLEWLTTVPRWMTQVEPGPITEADLAAARADALRGIAELLAPAPEG